MKGFQGECLKFLQGIVEKVLERSPLKWGLARHMESLVPSLMLSRPVRSRDKFSQVLMDLLNARQVTANKCDAAKQEFGTLLRDISKYHKDYCKEFDATKEGLDKFFFELVGKTRKMSNLWFILKMLLALSHG